MMSEFLYTIPYSSFDLWDVKRYSKITYTSRYSIEPLGRHIRSEIEKINLPDFPEETFSILGISNEIGMHDAYDKKGKEFNQPYKIVKDGYIAYNPYRVNVGSIGIKTPALKGNLISPAYVVFSCKETILPEFLFLLMKTNMFNKQVKENTSGSVRQNLTYDALASIKIPVPSLSEQTQIVARYNNTLMGIEIKLLEESTIYNIVENYLTKELKIVRKQNNTIGLFSTINYNELDTWGVDFSQRAMLKSLLYPAKKLIKLCSIGSGGTPSRNHPEYYQGTIPWVKTGEILNDIIYDTEEKITQEAINNSSAKVYPVGSLIMAMYGQGMTRGRMAKLGVDATTNQACAVMHGFKDEIYPDYLWAFFLGEYNYIRSLASGNNQPNLSAEKIKNYPIIVPPLDEQKRLAKEVFNLKEKLKNQKKEILFRIEKAKKDFGNAIFKE